MVSYQYAVVHQRGVAIELQITDSATINQLLDDLSASIAGLGASACKLPGGGPYFWRLYGLGEDMEKAWAMIVEHFCSHGWTSRDDQPAAGVNASRTMCFGLIQNEKSRETIQEPPACTSLA